MDVNLYLFFALFKRVIYVFCTNENISLFSYLEVMAKKNGEKFSLQICMNNRKQNSASIEIFEKGLQLFSNVVR